MFLSKPAILLLLQVSLWNIKNHLAVLEENLCLLEARFIPLCITRSNFPHTQPDTPNKTKQISSGSSYEILSFSESFPALLFLVRINNESIILLNLNLPELTFIGCSQSNLIDSHLKEILLQEYRDQN